MDKNKKIAMAGVIVLVLIAAALFVSLNGFKFFGRQRGNWGSGPFPGLNADLNRAKSALGLPEDATNEEVMSALGLPANAAPQQVRDALAQKGIGIRPKRDTG